MANKKQDTMEKQVREFLAKEKMISTGIARENLGIVGGSFRSIIHILRREGWDIELDPSLGKSVYRLISMPDKAFPARPTSSAFPIPATPYRAYTAAKFREMLVTLYGEMDNWQLAATAMKDFNLSHRQIRRWLTGETAVTGPAVTLADKLIEEHNAKTGRKP